MPPPRPDIFQRGRQRFSRLPLAGKIVVGFGAALLLVAIGAGVVNGIVQSIGENTSTATATVGTQAQAPTKAATATRAPKATPTVTSTPTITPTPKPTATPTPTGPRLITGAIFGGTEAAYTAKYGNPTYSQSNIRHYNLTTSDGEQVLIVITLDDQDPVSSDGKQHVNGINIVPADVNGSLNPATAQAIAQSLLPADAQHLKDIQDPQIGLIQVYVSADLAKTFPASAFTDSQTSQLLTPGTFSLSCDSMNGLHGGCSFVVGT